MVSDTFYCNPFDFKVEQIILKNYHIHCFSLQVNVTKEQNYTTFTDVEEGNVLLTVRYF